MESLKKGNRAMIVCFLIASAFLFWCVFHGVYRFENIQRWINALKSFGSIGSILAPMIVIMINGMVSSDWKSMLIFSRTKNIHPGCFAFSYFANIDGRVDKQTLVSKYGELPKNGKEQNVLWYKMYRKNDSAIQVHDAQRSWLLFRDLTAASIITGPIYFFLALFGRATYLELLMYAFFLIALFFLLRHIAKIYAERFVCNVLAIESSS